MAKDILKEAIADAKAVREVALANAKAALEEAFTPRLQSMLSAKLSEELNEEEEIEENKEEIDETYYEEDKEEVSEEVTDLDEEIDLEEILNELELEEGEDSKEETVDEAKEEDLDEAKDKDEDTMDEAKDKDLDEAKDDEEEKLDEARPGYKADDVQYMSDKAEDIHEDKEFNLDALLEEINNLDENEDEVNEEVEETNEATENTNEWVFSGGDKDWEEFCRNNPDVPHCNEGDAGMAELFNRIKETLLREKEEINAEAVQKELEETKAALETVQTELNEVNLLNSKLLYVNRIFKANNLDEAQKLRVVETLDNASNVKEAKLIYETIKDTFTVAKSTKKTAPKKSIKEGLGMASKAAGTSTAPKKPVLNESNDMVARMQKLANIKISQ